MFIMLANRARISESTFFISTPLNAPSDNCERSLPASDLYYSEHLFTCQAPNCSIDNPADVTIYSSMNSGILFAGLVKNENPFFPSRVRLDKHWFSPRFAPRRECGGKRRLPSPQESAERTRQSRRTRPRQVGGWPLTAALAELQEKLMEVVRS